MAFKEVMATNTSLSARRLVNGVGINDAWYMTEYLSGGKRYRCPYYTTWVGVINRTNSSNFKAKSPSYSDCTVCEDWLLFSTFRSWMEKQDWEGKALDKDLLVYGNKVYSPTTCLFITKALNSFIKTGRGGKELPQGVTWYKYTNKFVAKGTWDKTGVHLGYFKTKEEAERAYCLHKQAALIILSEEYEVGCIIKEALGRQAVLYSNRAIELTNILQGGDIK